MWDKLECTPHGRLGKFQPHPDAKPYALHNNITANNWEVPVGFDLVSAELPRGKRCYIKH